jgi:TRAP-type C4-dicarboxylate transport system substrate-binding protein
MSVLRRALVAVLSVASVATVLAAPVVIRLSTVAPKGTTWDSALTEMGAAWNKSTEGRVTLRVTGGAGQGNESTVVRYMRPEVNQVDAALLTANGLADIDDAFNVFGIPFFFQTDAEEQAVREKLTPVLSKRLEAKHFHLLSWGHGGWVQIFSTVPIKTLADAKRAKLFTSAGNDKMVKWYASNGFNPVSMEATNIAQGLATGMIQATPMPPYGAVALQVSSHAKYMLDINVDPLIGALVMTDGAWNKISAEDREKIVAAAKVMEKQLQTEVPQQDARSVVTMQSKQGLTVTKLDAAGAAAFRAEADKLVATMRGGMVPADVYDIAIQARDEYRKSHAK